MEDFYTTTTVKIPNELIGFRVQGVHGKPISLVISRKEGLLRKTRPGKAGGHINTNLATFIEHHRSDILTKTFSNVGWKLSPLYPARDAKQSHTVFSTQRLLFFIIRLEFFKRGDSLMEEGYVVVMLFSLILKGYLEFLGVAIKLETSQELWSLLNKLTTIRLFEKL